MAQPLAADLRERNFHAALVADHSAMLHALVLAAQAFPVRYRTKNTRAEQAIALGLERPVVDRFRLGDFTVRPAADLLRGCDADTNRVKVRVCVGQIKRARTIQGAPPLPAAQPRPPAALKARSPDQFLGNRSSLFLHSPH